MAKQTYTVVFSAGSADGSIPMPPSMHSYWDGFKADAALSYGGAFRVYPKGKSSDDSGIDPVARGERGTLSYDAQSDTFTLTDVEIDDAQVAAVKALDCFNVEVWPGG